MKILFVCKANVGRSQMAEAFFNKLSKKNTAISAGTHVESDPDEHKEGFQKVFSAMKEKNIDMPEVYRKQMTKEMFDSADKVVVITEKENLPEYAKDSPKVTLWDVADGKGKSYEFVCNMRDEVRIRVEQLVKEID